MIPTRRLLMPIVVDGRVVGEMPVDLSEQCATCAHWTENLQCEAFPELIPEPIRSGEVDHSEPYPGDHGVRFEAINPPPGDDAADADSGPARTPAVDFSAAR